MSTNKYTKIVITGVIVCVLLILNLFFFLMCYPSHYAQTGEKILYNLFYCIVLLSLAFIVYYGIIVGVLRRDAACHRKWFSGVCLFVFVVGICVYVIHNNYWSDIVSIIINVLPLIMASLLSIKELILPLPEGKT